MSPEGAGNGKRKVKIRMNKWLHLVYQTTVNGDYEEGYLSWLVGH